MGSTIADVFLALFIPLGIGIFWVLGPMSACLVVALGSEMFLPEIASFHIPFLPPLDKHNLPYLCILVGCLLHSPKRVTRLPKEKWFLLLSLLALGGGIVTGLTNGDPQVCRATGECFLPALTFKDGMFVAVTALFPSCVAFYLGSVLFRSPGDIEKLLAGLAIAGLIYCPFAIIEMRLSPQFHAWVYGYGVGAFNQTIRYGGYRPMVFMSHGLALARFFLATTLALFVLAKTRRKLLGIPVRLLAWFQGIVLLLCRSTGAIIMAVVGILFISLFKPKRQLLFATVLAVATLLYPLLRAAELFPVADILQASSSLNEDRRESLEFRFTNEDILLAHARERIAFGWGASARGFVFTEDWKTVATPDGHWIIILGISGVAGFLVCFGVLLWPVILTRYRLRRNEDERDKGTLAGLALIVALVTSDLIPNGLWAFYPYLLAGALARSSRELMKNRPE